MSIGDIIGLTTLVGGALGSIIGLSWRAYKNHVKPAVDQFKADITELKEGQEKMNLKIDMNAVTTQEIAEKVSRVERETRTNGGSTIKDDLKSIRAQMTIDSKAADSMLYLYTDPVFKADCLGNIIFVNYKWLQISGIQNHEDAYGIGWLKAVHPEDRNRVYAEWKEAMATESIFLSEYRIQNLLTKEITNVSVRTTPIRDGKNEVLIYLGIIQSL